jgi:hypothetical protein
MFLGCPILTDDKGFCTMMRDILFGRKKDEDFLKSYAGVYEAALKARKEIGADVGEGSFEYFDGQVRALKGEAVSQWHLVSPKT